MPVAQPRYLRSIILAIGFVLICLYTLSKSNLPDSGESHEWLSTSPDGIQQNDQDLFSPAKGSDVSESKVAPSFSEKGRPFTQATPAFQDPKDDGTCLGYERLQDLRKEPHSEGKREFPYSRPAPPCRTFNSTALEALLLRMKNVIKDPDLYRLFENAYPNTLDTTIKWRGYAEKKDPTTNIVTPTTEELAFIITGDINAMWLRDSASQIYSYLHLLEASSDPDSLASLWRGVINLQARYITISPYCHSFQPPPESRMPGEVNGAFSLNRPRPAYDPSLVFDCKWELDSLASFLQISVAYYQRTNDVKFFEKYHWIDAVKAAVDAAGAMRLGTYAPDGHVEASAWTFTGYTNRGSETLTNDGLGNPTRANGMVRSAFRPSDDAAIYQLLVPANMMFASYLESASVIMNQLRDARASNLTTTMLSFAKGIREGIDSDAIIHHKIYGDIFAYEIDGFGSANMMDDANIPSLLAMPLWDFINPGRGISIPKRTKDYAKIYENTRKFVLGKHNPYWAEGPVLSAVGGPHLGPGRGWPMAAIVRALTAYSPVLKGKSQKDRDAEVKAQLRMVLDSTAGTGVVHESVNAWDELNWTRAWFGWANGLLGELILKIETEEAKAGVTGKGLLSQSWQ